MKRLLTVFLAILLAMSLGTAFIPAQQAMAADGIYNVPSPSYPTIQAGIDDAYHAGGGTVQVYPGVYRESIYLRSGVKVLGSGRDVTIMDGGGHMLLVLAQSVDSTAVLSGFTITNGDGGFQGGGMYSDPDSSPTVTNCTFYGNRTLEDGGGMFIYGGTVTNCIFAGNQAKFGSGGMCIYGGTVTNCTFYANQTSSYGGGMSIYGGTVTNCTFYGNQAEDGGGMHIYGGTVTNCTFAGNQASDKGGGIFLQWGTVTNCILWGDSAETGPEIYPSGDDVTYCDVEGGYNGVGNINADPIFAEPGNLDFHLSTGSPCIDAGNNYAPALPATDFDGDDRIINGTVDMGVDETTGVANQPPEAVDDSATTDEDTAVTIDVLANDSDPDEDVLNVDSVTQGANGSVVNNAGDNVTYTPNADFSGVDSFTYTASDGNGGTATATVTITVNPLTIQVTIDIKPGSDPNSINLGSKGVVPVAVLTTDDFDASMVDPATVVFAGAEPERWTSEDVDGDGELDLLFHFRTQELDLTEDSEDATLTGQTTDGHDITGTDSVRIVPQKGKK